MKTQVMQDCLKVTGIQAQGANVRSSATMMRGSKHYLLALALLILSIVPAFGANITTLYSTGVDDSGSPLNAGAPNGTPDPHYKIMFGPSTLYGPNFTGGLAYTTIPASGWVAAPAGSEWVNPINNGTGDPSWSPPQGNYDYQTTFDICCIDPETVVIKGQFAADNNACIWVNGVNTKICTPSGGFSGLTPFQLDVTNSAFVAGVNQIDFVVFNSKASYRNGTPSGLVVSISSATGQ